MFDLDLELEFDDDFLSNTFTKRLNSGVKETSKSVDTEKSNTKHPAQLPVNNTNTHLNRGSSVSKSISGDKNSKIGFLNFSDFVNDSPNKTFNSGSQNNSTKLKRSIEVEEKPQKKKLTHEGLLQRKFPGPAGLLPDKPFKEIENFPLLESKSFIKESSEKESGELIIYSQNSGSVFLESPYQKLVSNFDLNEPNNPLNKYTVEWVKKTALNKSLLGKKVPFLAVVIHYINNNTLDPVLVLRDPTGEINGTLHREVWADMGEKLHSGIALALRQVGVLITGVIRRQVHLNITINNILSIYSSSEKCSQVEVMAVNNASKEDLFKSIEGWQTQVPRNQTPCPKNQSPNTLFSTITESESSIPSFNFHLNNIEIKNLKNNWENVDKTLEFKNKKTAKKDSSQDGLSHLETSQSLFSDCDFLDQVNIPENHPNAKSDVFKSKSESAKKENNEKISRPYLETTNKTPPFQRQNTNNVLSPAESLIFEEVLSGIDLDEFD